MEEFLKIAEQFKLGHLETEQAHPKTINLSELVKTNINQAIKILKEIDLDMLNILKTKISSIMLLRKNIDEVFENNGRVFLCGCGATGRLSLSLENMWNTLYKKKKNSVISFMAGTDVALVKSIENSEDHPEYAHKQLYELGFKDGDMLIASSEGGETPYVIGAVESSLKLSGKAPFFLYCNPDHLLTENIERSRKLIKNNFVNKINLSVGPMAISGSTRMQASTIIMAVIGYALLFDTNIHDEIKNLINIYKKTSLDFLSKFIKEEASIYKNNNYLIYLTKHYPMTILTDTTERSPTFNLAPFENMNDSPIKPSLSFLCVPNKLTIKAAWQEILKRLPRTANMKYLNGFNFSKKAISLRKKYIGDAKLFTFSINRSSKKIHLSLNKINYKIEIGKRNILTENLILKMILNIHSTLVMGLLDRYTGNIMTWVKPTNYKLIDRAIRYITIILKKQKIELSYTKIAEELFEELNNYSEQESIIIKTVEKILKNY